MAAAVMQITDFVKQLRGAAGAGNGGAGGGGFGFTGGVPPALGQTIGNILVRDVRSRFQTGTGPDGKAWRPLSRPRPMRAGQRAGNDKPLLDTGVLRNSIAYRVESDGVWVGSVLPYAAIHQFGGVIRPRNAKFLTIPLTQEAKRAGSPRRFPRQLRFVKTRTGWLMVERSKAATAQYVLVPSVTIPARPYLGVSKQAEEFIQLALAEWMQSQWGN